MKTYTVSLLFFAGMVLLATGCGKGQNTLAAVGQTLTDSSLMHTWASKCEGSKLLGVSQRTYYEFSGNSLHKVLELYQSGDCTGSSLGTVHYRGTFDLGSQSKDVQGARNIDLHYTSVGVMGLDDTGLKILNDAHFCGHDNYSLNKEIDVSPQAGSLLCPVEKLPRNIFGIYKVSGDTLEFGKNGGRATSPSARPTSLNVDRPFTKVDRSF